LKFLLLFCIPLLGIELTPQTPPAAVAQSAPAENPAQLLEALSQHCKARWRSHYRKQPAMPNNDRAEVAFTLGALLGETFLIHQAEDAQQFRNNNQDITTYCRTLGLSDKMMPRLLTQAKMAESGDWKALRQEIINAHEELLKALHQQMDADLANLVHLGTWLRTLEITSKLVAEQAELLPAEYRQPCSSTFIHDLLHHFEQLSPAQRESARLQPLQQTLQLLTLDWPLLPPATPASHEVLKRSHEQIHSALETLIRK
jgi:hypothetical protein